MELPLQEQMFLVLMEDLVQEGTLEELAEQVHLMILQDQLSQLLEVVVEVLVDIMVDLKEQVELVVVELVELDAVVVEAV